MKTQPKKLVSIFICATLLCSHAAFAEQHSNQDVGQALAEAFPGDPSLFDSRPQFKVSEPKASFASKFDLHAALRKVSRSLARRDMAKNDKENARLLDALDGAQAKYDKAANSIAAINAELKSLTGDPTLENAVRKNELDELTKQLPELSRKLAAAKILAEPAEAILKAKAHEIIKHEGNASTWVVLSRLFTRFRSAMAFESAAIAGTFTLLVDTSTKVYQIYYSRDSGIETSWGMPNTTTTKLLKEAPPALIAEPETPFVASENPANSILVVDPKNPERSAPAE